MKIPKYQYRAINIEGQIMEGILESHDRKGVVEKIRSKSFYPLEINELHEKRDFRDIGFWGGISAKDLSIFCKQFASMLKSGVPISEALDILADHTVNRKLKNSIIRVHRLMHTGKTLSESFSSQGEHFPDLFVKMIQASEISGILDMSLERMSIYFQREYTIAQKLKKALTYPAIVIITSILAIFFLVQTVVPQFIALFESYEIDLPIPTRIVIGVHNFISSYGMLLLICPFFIYILIVLMKVKNENRIRLHKMVFKLPIVGKLIKNTLSARFNRVLATLIAGGIPLTQALDITARTIGNSFMEYSLRKVLEEVVKGNELGYSLKKMTILPPAVSKIVTIGEKSGRLEEMMENIAEFYEIEVDFLVERIITLLEPLLVLVLGGIIATIVLAVALPIFDIFKFAG